MPELPQKVKIGDQLTKGAAILGAFFAVGQTASQIVQGYFQHKIDVEKTKQEIDLNKKRSDNELASTFLTRILEKGTSDADRYLLFGALATIDGHPLQSWAKDQHARVETITNTREGLEKEEIQRALSKSGADQ